MRRKIDNRSVILIILIATFTLLSYVFDQLVIRNEDKLRTKDIKYQNLYTERKSLESLSTLKKPPFKGAFFNLAFFFAKLGNVEGSSDNIYRDSSLEAVTFSKTP